jgi:hypothetical protein
LAVFVLAAACRTADTTTPVTTLDPSATERSMMRIRATSGEKTQSFRAMLHASPSAMLLNAYTPLGTSAFRLYSSGDRVVFLNDLQNTSWTGTPAQFAASFGFFGDETPVRMAQRILGRERSEPRDVTIVYDPPSFPPKRVTVTRGGQRLEIEHLESVYTSAAVEEPKTPRGYKCCVPPRL